MLKGKLTGLRAIEKNDLLALRDWRNTDEFRQHFREFRELNMQNQEIWFSRMSSSDKDFMFAIERLDDKKLIGACGLLYVNWQTRSADFSFYIGEGGAYIDEEGLAQDSAEQLLQYGFRTLNLHRVWCELYEFDQKKIDFFTKQLGFIKDGELRDNCFKKGRYWNSHVYSVLSHEYKKA